METMKSKWLTGTCENDDTDSRKFIFLQYILSIFEICSEILLQAHVLLKETWEANLAIKL